MNKILYKKLCHEIPKKPLMFSFLIFAQIFFGMIPSLLSIMVLMILPAGVLTLSLKWKPDNWNRPFNQLYVITSLFISIIIPFIFYGMLFIAHLSS